MPGLRKTGNQKSPEIKCDWNRDSSIITHNQNAEWVLVIGDLKTMSTWTAKACNECYTALAGNLGDQFWDPDGTTRKTVDMIEARPLSYLINLQETQQ